MAECKTYNTYQLVVKELWQRKETSAPPSGVGSFTAVIPWLPVDNYYKPELYIVTKRVDFPTLEFIHLIITQIEYYDTTCPLIIDYIYGLF